MPHLRAALASVAAQTFRDFELVVQDAASTDGTQKLLKKLVQVPYAHVVSERDGGIGDAFNRALGRCRGEIIGSIDADNLLEPDALSVVVDTFGANPQLAAAYASIDLIGEQGEEVGRLIPQEFELLRVMACELVPPFSTGFFARAACGSELRFDERLQTCADYDLWLRIGDKPIARISPVLGRTRLGTKSMSRDPERYDQFVRDKLSALRSFLDRFESSTLRDAIERRSEAGVWLWAAESIYELEADSPRWQRYLHSAAALDPGSSRLAAAIARVDLDSPAEPDLDTDTGSVGVGS